MILRFGLWVRMVLLKTCGYLLTPLREFLNLCIFCDRSSQGRLTGNGVVQLLWRVLDYRCEIGDQTGCLSSSRCNWRQPAPCQRPRCCSGASWGCTMCSHWCCVCPPLTTSTGPRMKNRPSTTAPSQQVRQMTDHRTVRTRDESHHVFLLPLQVSPGEPAALPTRLREPGTSMEKEWASGMRLPAKRGKYSPMTRETPRVRATTNTR